MKTKTLMKFCGNYSDFLTETYAHPWTSGGYMYFSNGFVVLRVLTKQTIERKSPVSSQELAALPWDALPERWYWVAPCEFYDDDIWEAKTKYGQAYFANYLLSMLSELPGCEIGPFGEKGPARIRFDGGDGIIMPM